MPSTGEKFPTVAVSVAEAPWSDDTWVTPNNIFSDNATTANVIASTFDSGDQTYVLKACGFDFSSIPDDATIDGVICKINGYYRSGQGAGSIDLLQLLDTSRAKVGTNQYATPGPLSSTTTSVYSRGSSSDKWGNALTPAWVKDPDFGVAVGIIATAANADVDIDYITLEVFYTEAIPPADKAAITALAQNTGTSNPLVTGTITPTTGKALVAVTVSATAGDPGAGSVSVSGLGYTWTLVSQLLYGSRRRIFVFEGKGTPAAGALTFTYSGGVFQEFVWAIDEVGFGHDTDFTGNAATGTQAAGTTLTATITDTSTDTRDVTWQASSYETTDGGITPEGGWTELHDLTGSNVRRMTTGVSLARDNTPSTSWASTGNAGGMIALVIKGGGTDYEEPAPEGWTEDFTGIASGNFLPRTGWTANQDPNTWQIYNPTHVLYNSGSSSAVYRDVDGSEDMEVTCLIKTGTGTGAGNTVGGIVGRVVDGSHYAGLEIVFHDGAVGGSPGPENAISFSVRDGVTHYEHKIAANFVGETYYELRMRLVGNRYTCWVDDVVIFDAFLTTTEAAVIDGGTEAGAINFVGLANYDMISAAPAVAIERPIMSLWNGSAEVSLALAGVWDGSALDPIGAIEIAP